MKEGGRLARGRGTKGGTKEGKGGNPALSK